MNDDDFKLRVLDYLARQQVILERLEQIITTSDRPGVLCNLKEASMIMGVSPTTFHRRWVNTGELKHAVGKRFRRADVMRLKRKLERF